MRKELPTEMRLFQRPKLDPIVVPEEIHEVASYIAALKPSTSNIREISEKMAQCTVLHQWLLRQKLDVLNIFPHLLCYNGLMVRIIISFLCTTFFLNILVEHQQLFQKFKQIWVTIKNE